MSDPFTAGLDPPDLHARIFLRAFALFHGQVTSARVQRQGRWLCAVLKLLDMKQRFGHADIKAEFQEKRFALPPPSLATTSDGEALWQDILSAVNQRPRQVPVPRDFRTIQNEISRINREWMIPASFDVSALMGFRACVRPDFKEIWREPVPLHDLGQRRASKRTAPRSAVTHDALDEKKPVIFVAMPFAEEFERGLTDIIEPAAELAGMNCVRADRDAWGHIHTTIFDRIFRSHVIVCDITGLRPNVLYELGVAHSCTPRTITIVREDYQGDVPFDIAPYRVLVYPRLPDARAPKERAIYERRAADVVHLLAGLMKQVASSSTGLANPVTDYRTHSSQLASPSSSLILAFDQDYEILQQTQTELVYVALSATGFAKNVLRYIEAGERSTPLHVRLFLLDLDDEASWRTVYYLKTTRWLGPDEWQQRHDDTRNDHRQTRRRLALAAKQCKHFSFELTYYAGFRPFWAYLIDGTRLILGQVGYDREVWRDLPVAVLVKDDLMTRALFSYYESKIRALFESASAT